MEKGKRMEQNKQPKWKFVRNIIITLIALGLVAGVFLVAPDYILKDKYEGTRLIINNKDVTASGRLKNELIIEDDVIYLSKSDISNFFDKYLYYDNQYGQFITTEGDKVATIKAGESKITINGITSDIKGRIIQKGNELYLPISDLNEVYNIDIKKIDSTNIILIDSLDREQIQAKAVKDIKVKVKEKILSRTIAEVNKDESVVIVSDDGKGWAKVRTNTGIIGFVNSSDLKDKTTTRQAKIEKPQIDGKISMVWDYYSQYVSIPNRQGTQIDGINVISPSLFELKKLGKGQIIDKTGGTQGKQYLEWARQNGYKIWPLFGNDGMIETTSEILNDYELRQKVIEGIVQLIKTYNLDGINIDFENMYKEDKDMYSRFIIELYPRVKACNAVLSVDLTAPDGGDTWSMCFDRNVIADNSDYIVFMAYDQYTAGSKKAGTTAGFNWVKNNIEKFLGQEGVAKEKIILAMPFYTRLWTEDASGNVETQTIVNMKDLATALPENITKTWNETLRQFYAEYKDGAKTKKIWIEDIKSLHEKLTLVNDYKLAGAAYWALDRQDDGVWNEIKTTLLK